MKIVIAADKFKGSLSSFEVCDAITKGILEADSNAEVYSFPMADGGDGFAEVLKYYLGTETVSCNTVDPLHRTIAATYQWSSHSKTAIIEMAVTSGLVLLNENERNPFKTSTVGTGILINDAIAKGASTIILGLGGSATNDAGIGILAAMGFQFIDEDGKALDPCGENLLHIKTITPPVSLPEIKFEIACDVQNVLYDEQGAAFVYGPQKGADQAMVLKLDEGLRNFALLVKEQFNKDIAFIPGAGAAGGVAAGLMGFFDVQLKKGVDMVINVSGIMDVLKGAHMLITGEGKIDEQSIQGKVVGRMTQLAADQKMACIAFCGLQDFNQANDKLPAVQKIISLASEVNDLGYSMKNAYSLLQKKVTEYFRERV